MMAEWSKAAVLSYFRNEIHRSRKRREFKPHSCQQFFASFFCFLSFLLHLLVKEFSSSRDGLNIRIKSIPRRLANE
jgi:hypothetical protein